MITISRAPPYLTVQDAGRKQSRWSGVPQGGAMDFTAMSAANAIAGNSLNAAALEWALGGGSIRFDRDCTFALAGATARATLAGQAVAPCTTTYARAGDELTVEQIVTGRFLYLAVAGGIDVLPVLGSRSTYLPGRFGGYEGRMLKSGDSAETRIVLKPGVFAPAQNLEIARGERYHVYIPQAVAERGEDYEIARFRERVRET